MTKRATSFALVLPLRDAGGFAHRWPYDALRTEILEARLRPGARLPAPRDLADQYGLARGTMVNAFEPLKSEGYVEGSVGSGTYLSKVLPDQLLQVPREDGPRSRVLGKRRSRISNHAGRMNLFPSFELRSSRAFRANVFPTTLWAQVAARRRLRRAVAAHLNNSRGVKCVPEQPRSHCRGTRHNPAFGIAAQIVCANLATPMLLADSFTMASQSSSSVPPGAALSREEMSPSSAESSEVPFTNSLNRR